MTLGAKISALWWEYRQRTKQSRDACVICRENLVHLGGGIETGHGDFVCSDACAFEYTKNTAW